MEILVTGRHLDVSESMSQFARDKVSRLQRLYDRIESVQIIIEQHTNRIRTEIVTRTDHKSTFVAQVEAEVFHESIDLAIDKMERQLREHKEKLRNRKHQPGSTPDTGM